MRSLSFQWDMHWAQFVPMSQERRIDAREQLALSITTADGTTGLTRDVSASGLYFECGGEMNLASEISFTLDLEGFERPLQLVGRGRVVRVEHHGESVGVGVKVTTSRFVTVHK